MHLYFIRHGQSENNARWAATGSDDGRVADPALTAVGQQQAAALAAYVAAPNGHAPEALHGFHVTHLYSSLMQRAVDTGLYLARALGLPLVAWEDLHERGGIFLHDTASGERVGRAGPNRAFFEENFPALVLPSTLGEAGWWSRPPEPATAVGARAGRVLATLLARHGRDDGVVFVSHGGFYNVFMGLLLALDPARLAESGLGPVRFAIHNTAVTRIDFPDAERRRIAYTNRVDFLPPHLIT